MKFIKPLSFNFKNKVTYITFFHVCGMLFNTYSNLSSSKLFSFFVEPSATIIVGKTNICIGEPVTITFEGADGVAPYTFTYTKNGDQDTKTTVGTSSSFSFNLDNPVAGNYVFVLTKVEDSKGDFQEITDQEIIIKVNALPTVDFTFDDTICSGDTVEFKSDLSGNGVLTYEWDFGDGTASIEKNPSHKFENIGCVNKVFQVKLLVKDENGCSTSLTKELTVLPKPDIEFYDTSFNNFNNCGNASTSYTINVDNSSNSSCINNYIIDWGDGYTESTTSFPISHTYTEISVFDLKIKATGLNGCENEVSYKVKNVSNPAGGLASPGSTSNICSNLVGSNLTFPITNYQGNSDDTNYIIDFGDGSPKETYTHAEITDNNKITHKYDKGSCSQLNNQFIAVLSIENACSITESTINNIVILEPSISNFDAVDISCINKQITFINKSVIGDNPNCSSAANFKWDFGVDGTDDDIVIVNNTSSITNQTYTYTLPGTYTVSLSVTSNCGTHIFTKEICIEPELTPSFTLNTDEGCIPLNINITNSTDESQLCSTATYDWEVDYTSDNCGDAKDWDFINGTKNTSENPEFIFKNPGKYTLTQNVITGCGTKKLQKS